MGHIKFPIASFVIHLGLLHATILLDRLREADGEVGVIDSCPTVRDAVTRQQGVVFHPKLCPEHFAVIVIDAMDQI